MLSARARQLLREAGPTKKISMIVHLRPALDKAEIAQITDARQRARRLDEFYRRLKQPFIDSVARYESAGMKVVSGLEGTPQFIVRGPARTWRRLEKEGAPLFSAPEVELMANEADWGVDRGVHATKP